MGLTETWFGEGLCSSSVGAKLVSHVQDTALCPSASGLPKAGCCLKDTDRPGGPSGAGLGSLVMSLSQTAALCLSKLPLC